MPNYPFSHRKLLIAWFVVVGVIISTAGAAAAQSLPAAAPIAPSALAVHSAAPDKVLRIVMPEPEMGMDPLTATTANSLNAAQLLHDPLVERDKDWKPIPWVAASWKTNPDSSEWTFTIRDGLKFSDGAPITADDVKFSFDRMMASAVWKGMLSVIKSVDVQDPKTVVIKLTRATPEFLDLPGGTTVQYSILSKAACQSTPCDYAKPGTAVSGPWYLKEYTVKSGMVLLKNPNYGIQGMSKFDRIEWTFTSDPLARVVAVQSGTADLTQPVAAADAQKLMNDKSVTLYVAKRFDQIRGFGFDLSRPPFNDKRVRESVGYLMEPQQIVDTCWYGLAAPLWGGIFYGDRDSQWGSLLARDIWKKPRPDRLQLVNQLLDQAGWRDINKDGIRESQGVQGIPDGTPLAVTLDYESNWVQAECHVLLVQDLVKDGGFKITPQVDDKPTFYQNIAAGKYQMWHMGQGGGVLPWEKMFNWFDTKGSLTPTVSRLNSPEVDAKLEAIRNETDMDKRKQLMSDMADFLADQQYIVATGSQDPISVTTSKLTNYFPQFNWSIRALVQADIPAQ